MTIQGAIATNRFGLGARPGDIDTANEDPAAWLWRQLSMTSIQAYPTDSLASSKDILSLWYANKAAGRQLPKEEKASRLRAFNMFKKDLVATERQVRARYGVQTDVPFHERLTRFWSNHFTVSMRHRMASLVAGAYEREAIRPHILSSFFDLAWQAITHPAMLYYLDNATSVGSQLFRRRKRKRGLNENLAREVLELHTVTTASGYSQTDVTELAKALTGWTIGGELLPSERIGETVFEPRLHGNGTRQILGRQYSASGGEQMRAILVDLCRHPATARNVAFKLARHFTADTPPESLVERLETAYQQTDGNLLKLYEVLIASPECWLVEPQKVKTPDEFFTSTGRLVGFAPLEKIKRPDILIVLGQRPLSALSPEGWPDEAVAWLDSNSIMQRIEWANRLSVRVQNIDARLMIDQGVGALLKPDTMQAVERAESGRQAFVLAIMSPDFQRR